jgi:hypothetical protein
MKRINIHKHVVLYCKKFGVLINAFNPYTSLRYEEVPLVLHIIFAQ